MAKVEIYTSMLCGFCYAAKALLKKKGVEYTEFDVMMKPGRKAEMIERTGGRTSVPQIFIGETHVGGYDEIAALDERGELDPLLGLG
ncbi:MAG: glutaredoxin 3 [Alphaproteobacteria bacterium]|nr:glutaredoxin 3 [Alphaproteobacteria bacterium]